MGGGKRKAKDYNGSKPGTTLGVATDYLSRGLAVVPVPTRLKRPVLPDWQKLHIPPEALPSYFPPGSNIGVLNGDPSGGLIDVDLDADEAVKVAHAFLPPTQVVFGRTSKRRSHWEYRSESTPNTAHYKDIDNKAMLVELRSTGSQTIWPGSTHPSGESVEFDQDGELPKVLLADLERAVALTATCALLARRWPRVSGSRHEIANAVAGFLLRGGLDETTVTTLVENSARAAGDEEWQARGRDVRATMQTLSENRPTTGAPTLSDLLGEQVVERISRWLHVSTRSESECSDQSRSRSSQATQLVDLADDVELFHTPDGDAYGLVKVDGHQETLSLKRPQFRRYLARKFYNTRRRVPTAQALQDAVNMLQGKADFEGKETPVFTRLAEHKGSIYLDLGNEKWNAVEITSTGWQIVDQPPVRFRRSKGMLPLPSPIPGGSVDGLRRFVNVANDTDWHLLVAVLLSAFRPSHPFPVLALHGEQGAAKSTAARVLRALVDPNVAPLRRPPKDRRDLMITATNNWVVLLDNLSALPQWLSDDICCLSTGGGIGARELYTDADEIILNVMRPVILTGITEVAVSDDLLDRTVLLYLPAILEEQRQTEADFWKAFTEAHPQILGALLDAVVAALRNLPTTKLLRSPRLADFATWATAGESGLGWAAGDFMRAYTGNREAVGQIALDDNLVDAVRSLLHARQDGFEGTATALLHELNEHGGVSDSDKKGGGWPKDARGLSSRLRRLARNLRSIGIDIDFDRRTAGSGSRRHIAISVRPSNEPRDGQGTVENDPPNDDRDDGVACDAGSESFSRRDAGNAA